MKQDDGEFLISCCDTHGNASPTMVCKHIGSEPGLQGFVVPDDFFMVTVCETCKAVLEEEVGWTDRAEKFVERWVICGLCHEASLYELISPSTPHGATEDDYARLVTNDPKVAETFGFEQQLEDDLDDA
jgi:hypothetical protein